MVLVAATLVDACALLPVGLVGAFAVSIRADLHVGSHVIGLAVGVFFLTGSLTAAVLGGRIDAFGARRTALVSGAATTAALLLVAVPGTSALALLGSSAVSGASFAMTMPATNALIAAWIPPQRRVLAVCTKQAAVPLALLLAAASVPAIDRVGGWHVGFLLGAAAFVGAGTGLARAVPPRLCTGPSRAATGRSVTRTARRSVLRLGVATMLASLLPGALAGYASLTLTDRGASGGTTTVVQVVANAAGIGTRVLSGLLAQRRLPRSWVPVSAMMVAGGVGALLLATSSLPLTVIGTVLAFGLGWGWSGLTYALVLVMNADNPGATGAVLQAGGMLGSAVGPLLMASVVASLGLSAGWLVAGLAIVVAGSVAVGGRTPAPCVPASVG